MIVEFLSFAFVVVFLACDSTVCHFGSNLVAVCPAASVVLVSRRGRLYWFPFFFGLCFV